MQRNVLEQGFTLIELLIVIVIIGVLASIALPTYQHYVHKSQTMEAVVLVEPAKLAVDQYALVNHGDLQNISNDSLNLPSSTLVEGAKNVASITISGQSDTQADIAVVMLNNLGTLTWTGTLDSTTDNMVWQCTYPTDSDLKNYAPYPCVSEGQ